MVVPRLRRSHLYEEGGPRGSDPPSLRPVMYGVALPRLCEITELMSYVTRRTGLACENLMLAEVYRHRVHRLLDGKEMLSVLRDDDLLIAYERGVQVVAPGSAGGGGDGAQAESSAEGGRERRDSASSLTSEGEGAAGSKGRSASIKDYLEEDSDFEEEGGDTDRQERNEAWPKSLAGFVEGTRVDGLDHQGRWYVGSVVRVDKAGELAVHVHFDRFSSRWDEVYREEDWKQGKLLPPHTKTVKRRRLVEVEVRRGPSRTSSVVAPARIDPTHPIDTSDVSRWCTAAGCATIPRPRLLALPRGCRRRSTCPRPSTPPA